jgi:hypothetical protein
VDGCGCGVVVGEAVDVDVDACWAAGGQRDISTLMNPPSRARQ